MYFWTSYSIMYWPCVSDPDVLTCGALLAGKWLPLLGLAVPGDGKHLAWEHASSTQPNHARAQHPTSFVGLLYFGSLFPCPDHPGPGTRQLEAAPTTPQLAEII